MLPFILGNDDHEHEFVVAPHTPNAVCPLCGGALEVVAVISGGASFIVGPNGQVDFNRPDFFAGNVEFKGTIICQDCKHLPKVEIHPATYLQGITLIQSPTSSDNLPTG